MNIITFCNSLVSLFLCGFHHLQYLSSGTFDVSSTVPECSEITFKSDFYSLIWNFCICINENCNQFQFFEGLLKRGWVCTEIFVTQSASNWGIILKWIFKNWDEEAWTGLLWLKTRTGAGYGKANLKSNGTKTSPSFKHSQQDTYQTNSCQPWLCCSFHSDTFLLASPFHGATIVNPKLSWSL